jgi:hypothetical protein
MNRSERRPRINFRGSGRIFTKSSSIFAEIYFPNDNVQDDLIVFLIHRNPL